MSYNYRVSKLKYEQRAEQEVLKARKALEEQLRKFNWSEEGERELKAQVKAKLEENLLKQKREFLDKAKIETNNALVKYREEKAAAKANMSAQEKTLHLLEQQQKVELFRAKAEMFGASNCIEDLDNIHDDPELFQICQGILCKYADGEEKANIIARKCIDPQEVALQDDIADVRYLDFATDTYVLPLAYQNKTAGELLFGVEDTSDFFFGSNGGVE